eukprot:scaffold70768_cov52-Cyclotella_meneghiniana.AAC.2
MMWEILLSGADMRDVHSRVRPKLLAQHKIGKHFTNVHVRLEILRHQAPEDIIQDRKTEVRGEQTVIYSRCCAIVDHPDVCVPFQHGPDAGMRTFPFVVSLLPILFFDAFFKRRQIQPVECSRRGWWRVLRMGWAQGFISIKVWWGPKLEPPPRRKTVRKPSETAERTLAGGKARKCNMWEALPARVKAS